MGMPMFLWGLCLQGSGLGPPGAWDHQGPRVYFSNPMGQTSTGVWETVTNLLIYYAGMFYGGA